MNARWLKASVLALGLLAGAARENLAAPTLIAPANTVYVSTPTPAFAWSGVTPYTQQLCSDAACLSVLYTSSTANAFLLYPASNLSNATTYYWRVQDNSALFSSIQSFVVDLSSPVASAYASISSTNGVMGESQFNNLAGGVTVQITIQDATSGLVVSTSVLAFAGDGHDDPTFASGFGVMYTTNAGQTWIDGTWTASNGGTAVGVNIHALAAFNGKLYAGDNGNGKIYSSADGNSWTASNGGAAIGLSIVSLAVFNGKLYAGDNSNGKIYSSPDGNSWTASNGGAAIGFSIVALAAFNGKLYAGDWNGKIYSSADGNSWTTSNGGAAVGSRIIALDVLNGKLYAGDGFNGKIYSSADGNSWATSNGGSAVGVQIYALAASNGRLYAEDASNGNVYSSADGNSWTTSNGGAAVGSNLQALAVFNGKLYAADNSNGKIFLSPDGNSWTSSNGGAKVGGNIVALAAFNGKLYAGDDGNGMIYQLSPPAASLSGTDGTTAAQTLKATSLNLVTSTNTATCNAVAPCGATNQVIFTASDLAGNVKTAGPYAILVDTAAPVAGCAVTANVRTGGVQFGAIRSALASLPTNMAGNECVVIRDAATYVDSVTIQGFTNNGFLLEIMRDPTFVSSAPAISPPAASNAAFAIMNASVTLAGVAVFPSNSMSFGVLASSPNVTITTVSVIDTGGLITVAGVRISSYDLVAFSSVTVSASRGIDVTGAGNVISASTVTSTAANAVVVINSGVQGNSVLNDYIQSANGSALVVNVGAANTTVAGSTMVTNNVGGYPVSLHGASTTSISASWLYNANGIALLLDSFAAFNTVSLSTVSSGGTGSPVLFSQVSTNSISNSYLFAGGTGIAGYLNGASSITLQGDSLFSVGAAALRLDAGASGNVVAGSTMTNRNSGPNPVLVMIGASANAISGSVITSPQVDASTAVVLVAGGSGNVFQGDNINSAALGGVPVMQLAASSGNSLSGDMIRAVAGGYGLFVTTFSNTNIVSQSTITAGGGGFQGTALFVAGASSNAFVNDYIQDLNGIGLYLLNSSTNTVYGSTVVSNAGSGCDGCTDDARGTILNNAWNNSIAASTILNEAGTAVLLRNASSGNAISQSSMTGTGVSYYAFVSTGGAPSNPSNNTISQVYLWNPLGGDLLMAGDSNDSVSLSTMAANTMGSAAVISNANSDTISQSVLLSPAGPALIISQGLNDVVSASQIVGSTAAVVIGSTNTAITASRLVSNGPASCGLVVTGGVGLTSVGSDTFTVTTPQNGILGAAVLALSTGPLRAVGNLTLRGDFTVGAVDGAAAFQAGNFVHALGGNLNISNIPPANFQAQTSTIVFDGNNSAPVPPVQIASFTYGAAPVAFNGLVVNVSTVIFTGAFTANVLTDWVSPGALTFPQAGPINVVKDLEIRGLGAPASFIDLQCGNNSCTSHTGAWPLNVVTISSVTGARVADSNASFGSRIDAGDGASVNLGNNVNWLFGAQTALIAPGQTYTPGVGVTGAVSTQTAGVPFPLSVFAVTTSSGFASHQTFAVTLNSSNPFGSPAPGQTLTQSLANGAATFMATALTAEPGSAAAYFPTVITSSSAVPGSAGLGLTQTAVPIAPSSFTQLQIVLPNEVPLPGSPAGKQYPPDAQLTGLPISSLTIRGVDSFFNLIPYVSSPVMIFATTFASATLPGAPQSLVNGSTSYLNEVIVYSSGTSGVLLSSVTNSVGVIANGLSTPFFTTGLSVTPPFISINVAGSSVATLGGALSGTVGDTGGVNKVLVGLQSLSNGQFYTPWAPALPPHTFTSPTIVFGTATMSAHGGPFSAWSIPILDGDLTPAQSSFKVTVFALDASGLGRLQSSTFYYNPSVLAGPAGGGQGSAFVSPAVSSGCEPVVTTVTYVVGAAGVQVGGGGVALRLPPGWTPPNTVMNGGASAAAGSPGTIIVTSTSAALGTAQLQVNAPSFGPTVLGPGWVLVRPQTAPFQQGEQIGFVVSAIPPLGPAGRGPQQFAIISQAAGNGSLSPVIPPPAITLNAGTTGFISFADFTPLRLGYLQSSPTMQLEITDLCGNPSSTNTVTYATMSALIGTSLGLSLDASATFYAAGGGIISFTTIPANSTFSPAFYYQTASMTATSEVLQATAAVSGLATTAGPAFLNYSVAARPVFLFGSSVALTSISVDTGTPSPGVTIATVAYGVPHTPVFIRFAASASGLPWDVALSTDPNPQSFYPQVFYAAGLTDINHPNTIGWDGINNQIVPARYVSPGSYNVRVRLAAGIYVDTSTQIQIATSPFIRGNLGPSGAGAIVRAEGPGATFGNNTYASTTGYFEIFGLVNQSSYNVTASTSLVALGQTVTVATTAFSVMAATAGTTIASLSLPATAFIRVNVTLPTPSPRDSSGIVTAHNASYTKSVTRPLHFYSGFVSSDGGGQSFGLPVSTWTYLPLSPDAYALDIKIPDLSISTTIANVLVDVFQVLDQPISLAKKSNVYGFVLVPSTASLGTPVSIDAQQLGSLKPTVFTRAVVPSDGFQGIDWTSAPYSLFGLDPGSWTLTAKAFGFASTQTIVLVSTGGIDLGDITFQTPGVAMSLSSGGIIVGTVTFSGYVNTEIGSPNCQFAPLGGYLVSIQAVNLQTGVSNQTVYCTPTGLGTPGMPPVTSSSFSIGGLDSGQYLVTASLPGFDLAPSTGTLVTVSTPAISFTTLALNRPKATAVVNIQIPPLTNGVCHSTVDYQSVGFFPAGPGAGHNTNLSVSSITLFTPTVVQPWFNTTTPAETYEEYWCSSMTYISPPQANGFFQYSAFWGPTGAFQTAGAALADGTTTTININLFQSTYSVSGKVSFSGAVTLPVPAAAAGINTVTVSSAPGLAAYSAPASYCLISSKFPTTVSSFHMELVPFNPHSTQGAPALVSAQGGSCNSVIGVSSQSVTTLGYVAPIQTDGSFQFPGVPAGDYLLRNDPHLDGNYTSAAQMGAYSTVVHVTANTSGIAVNLSQGQQVSGTLTLAGGLTASRPVAVFLQDLRGNTVAIAQTQFINSNAAPFQFVNVADGQYALLVSDLGTPAAFVAAPRGVGVAGAPVTVPNLTMQLGGTIKATLAVQQVLPNGAVQMTVVGPQNQSILPASLSVDAIASPWFAGGFYPALAAGAGGPALDANGQVVIPNVLPGAYNVEFNVAPGSPGTTQGGLGLVSTFRSNVVVGAGHTVNLGVVVLQAGGTLSGTVLDATTSLPIPNVQLLARPAVVLPGQSNGRNGYPTTFSDQNGHYLFTALDPKVRYYDVFAAMRVGIHQGDSVVPYDQAIAPAVDIQSTTTLNFSLVPAPYTLSGQVLTLNNEKLTSGFGQDAGSTPGAVIFLQKANKVPVANPVADTVFFTDAQGNFTIPSLVAGTYHMTITAQGYQSNNLSVTLTTTTSLGGIQMGWGATLQGSIRKADGAPPGEDEVGQVIGVTPAMTDFFFGALTRDPISRGITGYRLSGFQTNVQYRLMFMTADGQGIVAPPEGSNIVFTSSRQVQQLDVVFRPSKPFVISKHRRAGNVFNLIYQFSNPLRGKTPADDNLSAILTTVTAQGTLSGLLLTDSRQTLTAAYTPAVGESSFTLHVKALSAVKDPDSLDPVSPEFVIDSTVTYFVGVDGVRANVNALSGAAVAIEGDTGRVTLPRGAFAIDASSGITVLLQKLSALTNTSSQQGTLSAAAVVERNLRALSYPPSAYPPTIVQAVAAVPQTVSPFSGFYDVLLPLGVRTALSQPTPMTIAYSTGVDPTTLNLYWYNAAANAYVLQQDVTGQKPIIDTVNHTITVNVNHFSTFVLFNTGVEVITGNTFGGQDISIYNFPNPFNLNNKIVQAIHGGGCAAPGCTVRGTMISISVPPGDSGDSSIRIFNVAGERVRTLNLGTITGGSYFYQEWDGRNDSGRDVASGVYIGEVKIGGSTKFFKMALIK